MQRAPVRLQVETPTDKRVWRSRDNEGGFNGAARANSRCSSYLSLPHLLHSPPHPAPLLIVHALLVYGEGAKNKSEAKLGSEGAPDGMRCVLQTSKMTKMSTTPALAGRDVVLAPRKISSKRSQCSSLSEYGIHPVSDVSDPNAAAASLLIVRLTDAQTTRRWKDSATFSAFHTTQMNRFFAHGPGAFLLSLPVLLVIMQ